MRHLTGNKRLGQSDRDLARVGDRPISKASKHRAILAEMHRVNEEIDAFCDTGRHVSDLREARLRKREKKKLLQEAKRVIYAETERKRAENLR